MLKEVVAPNIYAPSLLYTTPYLIYAVASVPLRIGYPLTSSDRDGVVDQLQGSFPFRGTLAFAPTKVVDQTQGPGQGGDLGGGQG